jgi:hypothetical protein
VQRTATARFADAGALLAALEAASATPPAASRRWWLVGGALLATGAGAAVIATRGDEPSRAKESTPAPAPAKLVPRQLTSLGGCANTPVYLDGANIAFTMKDDASVDIMVTTGDGRATKLVEQPKWDWLPSRRAPVLA